VVSGVVADTRRGVTTPTSLVGPNGQRSESHRTEYFGNEYGADEAFMVKPLREGALDDVDGIVTYQPEFQQTDD